MSGGANEPVTRGEFNAAMHAHREQMADVKSALDEVKANQQFANSAALDAAHTAGMMEARVQSLETDKKDATAMRYRLITGLLTAGIIGLIGLALKIAAALPTVAH